MGSDEAQVKKVCTKCGGDPKPLSDFAPRYDQPGKYRSACKACHNAYIRQRYKEVPELYKGYRQTQMERIKNDEVRSAKYLARRERNSTTRHPRRRVSQWNSDSKGAGLLTEEAYLVLLDQQGGVCAICGKEETVKHQNGQVCSLAIDHDHLTGEIRGLLCFRCNTALARLENGIFAANTQSYLTKRKAQ
jgi:hypothetical protein